MPSICANQQLAIHGFGSLLRNAAHVSWAIRQSNLTYKSSTRTYGSRVPFSTTLQRVWKALSSDEERFISAKESLLAMQEQVTEQHF